MFYAKNLEKTEHYLYKLFFILPQIIRESSNDSTPVLKELSATQNNIDESIMSVYGLFNHKVEELEDEIDIAIFNNSVDGWVSDEIEIAYKSPQFGRYLGTLQELDKLFSLYEYMWIDEEIDGIEKIRLISTANIEFNNLYNLIQSSYNKIDNKIRENVRGS
jgi:hypothetical protein